MLEVSYPVVDNHYKKQKVFGAMRLNFGASNIFIGEIIHSENVVIDDSYYNELDEMGSYGCIYSINDTLSRLDLIETFSMKTSTRFHENGTKKEEVIIDGKKYNIYVGEVKAQEIKLRGQWDEKVTFGVYKDEDVFYKGDKV